MNVMLPTHNGLGKGRKGWLATDRKHTHRLNLQQAGGDVMFWSGIISGDVVSLWQVLGGDKMTIQAYIEFIFLKVHRLNTLIKMMIFMHSNISSHAAKKTSISE